MYIVGHIDKEEEPFDYIFGRFRRIVNSFPGWKITSVIYINSLKELHRSGDLDQGSKRNDLLPLVILAASLELS